MAREQAQPKSARGRGAERMTADEERGGVDRRERIIEAARRRFAEVGYETTSVRQIAEDVNLLAGSLYHHFATKEEMLHQIVRDPITRLCDRAEEIGRAAGDAEQRLVALIFADVEELTTLREAHAILHQERSFFRRSADFAYVLDARRAHYRVWRGLLGEGIAEGLFDASINAYLTISTIVRMLNTGAEWYVDDDRTTIDLAGIMSLDALCAFYVRFVLHAIRAPERVGAPIPWPAGEPATAD